MHKDFIQASVENASLSCLYFHSECSSSQWDLLTVDTVLGNIAHHSRAHDGSKSVWYMVVWLRHHQHHHVLATTCIVWPIQLLNGFDPS